VAGGQGDVHRILEQGNAPHPGSELLARAAELVEKRQVELTAAKPRHDLLGLALGKRHLDAGMCGAKGRDREGHQRGTGGRERCDA
jgi:hypothetical protein